MDGMVLQTQQWLNKTYIGKTGYKAIAEDGVTGWGTMKGLTICLQIELGIASPNGNFGPATTAAFQNLSVGSTKTNQVYILQGALFCKGYNPGGFTGTFGDNTKKAITQLQSDAGLNNSTGIVNSLLMKSILSMDAFALLNYGEYSGDSNIRIIQQNLNRDYSVNQYFATDIGLVPCDGIYGRATNKALLYGFQIEEGLTGINGATAPNGVFGPTTKSKCPVLSSGSTNTKFIYLLQYALYCNGFNPNGFDGQFGNGAKTAVTDFQKFSCLSADGIAGMQTWASLLVSTGDNSRKGTMCDCATTITAAKAQTLKNNGYKSVGRYLTGKFKMTQAEINTVINAGLRIYPIMETGGYQLSYFNSYQGNVDAKAAIAAAHDFGFEAGTIIYFTVDFDALDGDVTTSILPYFNEIYQVFKRTKTTYKIGIYAPRHVCSRISEAGLSCSSFVCDMSSGFSGNLGYPLPKDWGIDQISTITIGTGDGKIEIDNNISSGKDMGVSYIKIGNNAAGIEDTLPPPTNSQVNNILIFQSARNFRTNADGTDADDLKINDFTKDELLAIHSNFKYQLDGSDNPDILFKEFSYMATTFFSNGEMEGVILDMINHMKTGSGENYSNDILKKHVIAHESTKQYVDCIKNELINQLISNNGDLQSLKYIKENSNSNPLYNYINTHATRPVYNTTADKTGGLTIALDDTWGNNAIVRNYSVTNKHFNGTIRFNIYDHFGLDKPDVDKIYVELAGFRAWFVLQHYDKFNGKYKPFVTQIEFDVPFEGTLN